MEDGRRLTTPPDHPGPRIARRMAEQTGEQVQVHAVAPLPGGACQDLFLGFCSNSIWSSWSSVQQPDGWSCVAMRAAG